MKLHNNHINITRAIGVGSSLGFSLLLLAILCPTSPAANAANSDSINTLASVNVTPTISIATNNRVELEVTPKSTGSFSTSTTDLLVSTNSRNGYSIYMSTIDGSQTLNSQNGFDAKINPTNPGATTDNFANNTWGYSLDSGENKTYQPIPASSDSAIKQTDTSSIDNHYDLTFGVMVDTSLPAGQYANMVAISAIANPMTVTSIADLYYMQDMTSAICESTPMGTDLKHPVTTQLIDTRDGKKYWVAKLADGRCWMTQNLAFDIKVNPDGTSNVRAGDSDVTEDWNVVPSGEGWEKTTLSGTTDGLRDGYTYTTYTKDGQTYYPPTATENVIPIGSGTILDFTTYSWDLGEWVITDPTDYTNCSIKQATGDELKDCTNLTNVTGWSPTFSASTTSTINTEAKTYDPHYLFGNYYQWNTTTAGSGASLSTGNAPSSICPKGWKQPNTYTNLLGKYGITNSATGTVDGVAYDIDQSPLYFVRSGMIDNTRGNLNAINSEGNYWSSTATTLSSSIYSKFLHFKPSYFNADNIGTRASAFPIRCVNNPAI